MQPSFVALVVAAIMVSTSCSRKEVVPSPTDLKATPIDACNVRLQWSTAQGVEGYFIVYDEGPGTSKTAPYRVSGAQTDSAIVSKLQPKRHYYFHVSAYAGSSEDKVRESAPVDADTWTPDPSQLL